MRSARIDKPYISGPVDGERPRQLHREPCLSDGVREEVRRWTSSVVLPQASGE